MKMRISRRTLLAGCSAVAAFPAFASAWPTRPVTLIHGFPAGGPADTLSRILADGLSRHLGQKVVVEARPGATGTTAGGFVARAQPDGYTLMALPATYPTTAAMLQSLPYRPVDDFTFISTSAEYPLVLVAHPESGIYSIADVMKRAHSQSAPLLYGTAGVGSLMHLAMELFAIKTDIKLQHVPYQGGLAALNDLFGRRTDLVLDPPGTLIQFVRAQKLRAIAVTGERRFEALPEVPTMIESGVLGFNVIGYGGIVAPRGLPQDIASRIHEALAAALSEPEIAQKLKNIGNEPKLMSPEQFKARVAADIDQWKRVVADAKIARI
jgi:tripartite-type tricarboxylate transporter receptor subunit TctC